MGCIIWSLLALLLIPLLWMLLQMSSEQTTPPPVILPPGVCKIFGDPHLITFDQKHVSFYSQGEYWIVKSQTVHIQGRYFPTPVTHGLSATRHSQLHGTDSPSSKVSHLSGVIPTPQFKPLMTATENNCSEAVMASSSTSFM